jgi:hypothetical protein
MTDISLKDLQLLESELDKEILRHINKEKFGWSKWEKSSGESDKVERVAWCCQACGEEQPLELSPYRFAFDSSKAEHVRICSKCIRIAHNEQVVTFYQLIAIVRPHR